MKNTVIEKDDYRYKWSVRGLSEGSCIKDIESNHRTDLTDYVATMFAERYGCVAEVEQVRVMTHNQYQDYLKDNAARLYSNEGYTFNDYKRDAAAVEVLDFDLGHLNLPLSDKAISLINSLLDRETTSVLGNIMLQGHNDDAAIRALANELGCYLACDNYYNGFYRNDKTKCVLEFCEGDISLVLCETDEAYRAEVERHNKFYEVEEDEVCIEVYFDNVHMDSVYCSKDKADAMISSLVQTGYEDYNGDVKEYWKYKLHGRDNPDLSFKVVEMGEKSLDTTLAEAVAESEKTGRGDAGMDEYVKE